MTVRILNGDCREVLRTLPADSVHCVVTSPPYWGLRDYGVSGQIGLEPTYQQFIAEMVSVFSEVRRVLRADGTLWLNLGDSYAANGVSGLNVHRSSSTFHGGNNDTRLRNEKRVPDGLKPKDLCGIPWRVALALQEDGWWLRQDIIWSKPNPMPESVTDRCTKAHEYLFLLSKSARYYFDAEAIKETASCPEGSSNGPDNRYIAAAATDPRMATKGGLHKIGARETRNKRSVWEVATAPFSEAHFATFPPDLIFPCIKAGSSEKGCCGKCGAPWVREVERDGADMGGRYARGEPARHGLSGAAASKASNVGGYSGASKMLGWSPSCQCQAPVIPCTVLDPFGGAGTTGLVADRLQRNAILIELNPQYAEMAKRRVFGDAPLFADSLSPS